MNRDISIYWRWQGRSTYNRSILEAQIENSASRPIDAITTHRKVGAQNQCQNAYRNKYYRNTILAHFKVFQKPVTWILIKLLWNYSSIVNCRGINHRIYDFFHPLQFISTPKFTEMLKISNPSQLLSTPNWKFFKDNFAGPEVCRSQILLYCYFPSPWNFRSNAWARFLSNSYNLLAECVPVTDTSVMYLSSFLKVKICKTTWLKVISSSPRYLVLVIYFFVLVIYFFVLVIFYSNAAACMFSE